MVKRELLNYQVIMRKVMSLLVILSLCFTMSCQKQKAKEEEGMFTKAAPSLASYVAFDTTF
jgi:hypothetical protein